MGLIERATKLLKEADEIKKDYESIVDFNTYGNKVHLNYYLDENEFSEFLELAGQEKIEFRNRGDIDYPFEAYFIKEEIEFFILLEPGKKERLEGLTDGSETI